MLRIRCRREFVADGRNEAESVLSNREPVEGVRGAGSSAASRLRPPVSLAARLGRTWAALALKRGVHPGVVQEHFGYSTISIMFGMHSHVGSRAARRSSRADCRHGAGQRVTSGLRTARVGWA